MNKRHIKIIFRQVRDANLKYRLIEDGDRVAVGMSGGKDSFTLLYLLFLLRKYTPLNFELYPIYIDLGWDNEIDSLKDFCSQLGLPLTIETTNIGEIVFHARQERHPCSLCANLRRGALNRTAKSFYCNKVALGHHLNDVVNTLFMSMLYESRFQVFKPKTYLDRMDITVVRPLVYVEEHAIQLLVESMGWNIVENRCPADGTTKRTEISALLNHIEAIYPGARRKFLASLENVGPDVFWKDQ
ncbi:tRNA lysidine(34) synthetase [Syntrophomonas erecta]